MKSALTHWPEIEHRIHRKKRIFLALDFDGVLAPIVRHPNEARMLPAARALLQKLHSSPGVRLAVISGRALRDVEKRLNVDHFPIAGNHGLEMKIQGRRRDVPLNRRLRKELSRARETMRRIAERFPPARVEDKGVGLSFHYRELPKRRWPRLVREFEGWRKKLSPLLRMTYEKRVFEIRPRIAWDKGNALLQIWREIAPAALPFYLGDDTTDEDAFRALRHRGITVFVGKHRGSRAEFSLHSPKQVVGFLKKIGAVMERCAV